VPASKTQINAGLIAVRPALSAMLELPFGMALLFYDEFISHAM